MQHIQEDVKVLSGRVHATSKTAERVGSRVRCLDEEMKRVREAMDRVVQVMELKVFAVLLVSITPLFKCSRHRLVCLICKMQLRNKIGRQLQGCVLVLCQYQKKL